MGATTFQTGIFCKEGDTTGRPKPRLRASPDTHIIWPTLVIEAGESESRAELRNDKDRWFAHSNFEVKIVLLVKVEKQSRLIIIEQWEREPTRNTTTQSQTGLVKLVKTITVQTLPNSDLHLRASYDIQPQSAQLHLSFHDLFLRPIQSPREHDIIITTADLQQMAVDVWSED